MTEKIYLSYEQPFFAGKDKEKLRNCFIEEMKKADELIITVAFSSYYSLLKLEWLVEQCNIKNICVILGMYYFIDPLEELYITVKNINAKWQKAGIGEIKIVHSDKYHGKIYYFIKDNQIFSAIFGSTNLSFLHYPVRKWEGQIETSLLIRDPAILKGFLVHAKEMQTEDYSYNISNFEWRRVLCIENFPSGTKETYKIKLTKRP